MVDAVGQSSNAVVAQRSQSTALTARSRGTEILPAAQASSRAGSSVGTPSRVFSVVQTGAQAGDAAMPRMPRGSLIDVLV